jgi:hypothetical protein
MTILDHVVQKPLEVVCRKNLKKFREVGYKEGYKQRLNRN